MRITETVKKQKKNKVTWDKSVIDNEHMNRRSSKICCIHHSKKEDTENNKYEPK